MVNLVVRARPVSRERPVPDLVTEIPGPRARAHVRFDETWTSPSLPRAYPIVPIRGEGLTIEDIDGNLFLDFAAGIAVTSTGHAHPRVVAAIKEQAAELLHFSASDFYLPIYAEVCRRLAELTPVAGGRARVYLENARLRGEQAFARLRPLMSRFPGLVRDVRGRGLMIGVEFDTPERAEAVQSAAFQRSLLVLECGRSTVRLSPALTVSADEIETALRILGEAVSAAANHGAEAVAAAATKAAHPIFGLEAAG